MGREPRKVPKGWEHPKNSNGDCIALHDGHNEAVEEWWLRGRDVLHVDALADPPRRVVEEWIADRPDTSEYMLVGVPGHERTHWQQYEITSGGTPVSPVFETWGQLKAWLIEHRPLENRPLENQQAEED